MKKIIAKYVILIVVTFAASIFIYKYVMANTPIDTESDIFYVQNQSEKQYLSNTNYTIDNPNVILNPYGNSPLSALIVFQTKDLTTTTVTIKGKDGANDLKHTFTPTKVHILPIYGLYAGYDNKVIIEASGIVKEITITTSALPDDFSKVTDLSNKNFDTNEFYFTTPEEIGYTAAYDENGEVRWYLIGDYKWDIQRLNNGHILLSSDKTLRGNYSIGLIEMDLLGKVYYEYTVPGGYHHDVYELNNGNLLLASNRYGRSTLEDIAVEIDRASGNIVKEIDLYKILPGEKKNNWFGMNSINYDINTNSITMSGYNGNMIVNLDYTTLDINWIIADENKVSDDYKQYLLKTDGDFDFPNKPESVNLLNDNKMIFASEVDGKKHLLTYQIDYSNRTVKELDDFELPTNDETYLEVLGDDDFVITQGHTLMEVKDNTSVISMNVNSTLYNTKKMSLYANDVYTGVYGVRLGNLGESKTINNYLLLSARSDDDILDKYNISFYKDVYGLKVSGTFKESDEVQIILDNVLDKKTYSLLTPIDSNKKVTTSRYISEDGIKGKYYIYLRINGTIYKLHKYVNFY